jgi:hypothetical protein
MIPKNIAIALLGDFDINKNVAGKTFLSIVLNFKYFSFFSLKVHGHAKHILFSETHHYCSGTNYFRVFSFLLL